MTEHLNGRLVGRRKKGVKGIPRCINCRRPVRLLSKTKFIPLDFFGCFGVVVFITKSKLILQKETVK